jgi:hypothetical protein
MPTKYAAGKYAIAECDRCAFRYKLSELRTEIVKTKPYRIKVCKQCWNPDQPQLQLGLYPVNDPQAVHEPRPDVSYQVSGQSGVRTNIYDPNVNNQDDFGYPETGSRIFQWGWNPVGGARGSDTGLTPNNLICVTQVGTVSISTT